MASRTIVTLSDFYQRLQSDSLKGSTAIGVDMSVKIDASIINWESRVINYVFFEEIVEVTDVDINLGLHFAGCHFNKGIIFNKVKNTGIPTTNENLGSGVSFLNCKAQFITFQNVCEINRGVVINGKCEIQRLSVLQSKIENGGLKVNESTISVLFEISNCDFPIRISDSGIKTFRVENLKGDIAITNSNFTSWAKFWNMECPNSFTLNRNTFEDEFEIKASRVKGIFIHGDTFLKKGRLENRDDSGSNFPTDLQEIYITEANFLEGFEFDGMSRKLKKLTLPMSPNFQGVLRIIGWKIQETWITGINQNLKLIFKRIDFKRIIISDFSNFGVISFDECNADNNFNSEDDPDSSFHVTNSSLSNTRFSEFDFDSFDFISFTNASLEGIEASNVRWFSVDKLQIDGDRPQSEIGFRRAREIYRQIKQSLKSKGNQIDSLIFQAREMRAYRNELKMSENYNISDKIVMTVNQSNNFGMDWLKPLLLIFVITLVTYIVCLPLFSANMVYDWNANFISIAVLWNDFIDKLPTFAQMFNPARRFSITYGQNVSTSLYFIDLLHRAILGILIFQLISAFRRLSSK